MKSKQARNIGLSETPVGPDPRQMAEAVRLFSQARTLATPSDRELKQYKIRRPAFEREVGRLQRRANDKFTDARYDELLSMIGGGVGGAALGFAGSRLTGDTDQHPLMPALTGLFTGGAGALIGRQRARMGNSRLARTLQVLRGRGVLSPQDLDKVSPLLLDYQTKTASTKETPMTNTNDIYTAAFNRALRSKIAQDGDQQSWGNQAMNHLQSGAGYLGKNPWAAAAVGAGIAGLPALFHGRNRGSRFIRNALMGGAAGFGAQQGWHHRDEIKGLFSGPGDTEPEAEDAAE